MDQAIIEDDKMEAVQSDQDNIEYSKKRKGLSGLFLNVNVFAVIVCWYTLSFFMVEMYFSAVITSIEKRFGFRSSSSGSLISIKEIAYVCTVALSSHFGNRWHAPRFLALMAIIMALASALYSLPHFIYDSPFNGNFTNDSTTMLLCKTETEMLGVPPLALDGNNTKVAQNDAAYTMFAVSSAVMGFAQAPMVSISTTYMDDAVGPVNNAIYLAFMALMRALGPVLAFLAGALFTSFYETLKDPGYDASDPRWVGAWWLGYLIFPCLVLGAGIFIAPFPRTMPRTWEREEEALLKTKTEERGKENAIIDLLRALVRLLCNPIYMALMAAGCFTAFILSGMLPFLPKYMEVQFNLSASTANILIGVGGSLLAGVGALSGGALSSRLKLRNSQSACLVLVTSIVFVMSFLIMMSVSCPSVTYVGVNNKFNETCSANCGCVKNKFYPVCGSDGLTYTSPCMAGCKHYYNETLEDCSCVGAAGMAVLGSCDSGCQMYMWILYMVALGLGTVIHGMAAVPATNICLRCVEERDRSLGMGVVGMVVSLIGFMPGPIVYGLLIDSTCVLWSDSCDSSGYCRVYDNDKIRFLLHGVSAVLLGVATLFYLLVWILVRREEKKVRSQE